MEKDKKAEIGVCLRKNSYVSLFKSLRLCILILSHKIERFHSHSHQLGSFSGAMWPLPVLLSCIANSWQQHQENQLYQPHLFSVQSVRADEMGEMYFNKTIWLESHHNTTRHSMGYVHSDPWPLDTLVIGNPWPVCLNSCHSICH